MITTVLFDLDDTILDFHKAERSALSKALQKMGVQPNEEILNRYHVINKMHWEMLERKEITRADVTIKRFEMLYSELGLKISAFDTQKVYEKFLGQGHYFFPDAEELLIQLKNNYDLYLVSNGSTNVQTGRIESAGLKNYFKDIFISEKLGHNKPSKEFFDICFTRIPDLNKEETIIIGDSLSSDIQGGINAGIHTCWYNPTKGKKNKDVETEYEVSDLKEIPILLQKI